MHNANWDTIGTKYVLHMFAKQVFFGKNVKVQEVAWGGEQLGESQSKPNMDPICAHNGDRICQKCAQHQL